MRRALLAIAATVAVAAFTIAPAAAGTRVATGACQSQPACVEPVAAVSTVSADDLTPPDDGALTYTGTLPSTGASGGPVSFDLNNNAQDGTQDWRFVLIGFVPAPNSDPPYPFGLTAFDLQNYAARGLYELEYMPFSQDSGLCLTINKTAKALLRPCASTVRQVFIIDAGPSIPLLNNPPPPYELALLVAQAATGQHHKCLTASESFTTTRVTVARCQFVTPGQADDQMWSAIP
jgi:hypothetical protein